MLLKGWVFMKKFVTVILCLLMIFSISSCGKKNNDTGNANISDIPTASADENEVTSDNSADEFDNKYSADENEGYVNYETNKEDFRSERERIEIENSIRDAEDLVANGDYEDAMMIIKGLKTRKLSKSESARLTELQKQMTTVSD